MIEGIININKPYGITSHDVVMKVRRKFNMRKVGHAGALDPIASGVMILLLGKATKLSRSFMNLDKAYRSTMLLGTRTNSLDIEGKIIKQNPFDHITKDQIESVLENFKGEIKQVPPMFSAVKINGKKLYKLARKGIEIEREPRNVRIDCLKLEEVKIPKVKFYLECSKGTYVRQLAEDIGCVLGCGACIEEIERVKVGDFNIKDSVNIEDLNESHIQHWRF